MNGDYPTYFNTSYVVIKHLPVAPEVKTKANFNTSYVVIKPKTGEVVTEVRIISIHHMLLLNASRNDYIIKGVKFQYIIENT